MNILGFISKKLLSLNSFELTALSVLIGLILTDDLNSNEIQSLGNFYELIGQVLLSYGAQLQNLNSDNKESSIESAIAALKKKISNIDTYVTDLRNLKF